jgi:hypothetical protein
MTKNTGVSKIVITIGGKEIACTPEQIKDLKECLDKLYGENTNTVIREYRSAPYPWWQYPPALYKSSSYITNNTPVLLSNSWNCQGGSGTVSLCATAHAAS